MGGSMSCKLPVMEILPELRQVLADHPAAVLAAPPGSGKTTLVPPGLLQIGRKIIMLEPRRLAARAAANRIAELLDSEPGTVNTDATGNGWICKIRLSDPSELDELMEKTIPDCAKVVYMGRTHYAFLEELSRTVAIVKTFFKE